MQRILRSRIPPASPRPQRPDPGAVTCERSRFSVSAHSCGLRPTLHIKWLGDTGLHSTRSVHRTDFPDRDPGAEAERR
ncbi:hypothetical protein GN956_G10821 [Arapaima gigas]